MTHRLRWKSITTTSKELEANEEEDVILELFSLETNSFVIDPMITVLNKLDGNLFFGFMVDG